MDFTSFSHLLADLSSPVSLTSSPRPMPTHLPSRPPAFLQEGIDAISDVIYHIETYDVTTIRASTPMFLMSRKIKALGVKMVLSGEGSDEIFGGYLYFHKAPDKAALHEETCQKVRGGGGGAHAIRGEFQSVSRVGWGSIARKEGPVGACGGGMELRSGVHLCACSVACCTHVLYRLDWCILSIIRFEKSHQRGCSAVPGLDPVCLALNGPPSFLLADASICPTLHLFILPPSSRRFTSTTACAPTRPPWRGAWRRVCPSWTRSSWTWP